MYSVLHMKSYFDSLSRILTLFLLVVSLNGLLSIQLLDTECVECAETDFELFEEIEEMEEGRSHWRPTFSSKIPPWLLFQNLFRHAELFDDQYALEYSVTKLSNSSDEQVGWMDSASETYLFCGDSSPPYRV